ncbi:zinc metalloprotease HtpX [Candidatus Uhrbacteria bacterium RIFCSPHIGHO2_12_FULL_46_13]|uniref:Protease HtpX homolog n=1 Tax=Candidatus Uhrbacteria bacterium RIFCSPLOWO2_01_FULL_47_25 TaxID=1802402 RepID=A0A1F7UV57_9BACT|nr:MAG: Protease HtpX-like protein [Parcubacteria group bacterium GW2011_GWA2_46_9]OGL59069.1 MAG: zinc metalloprotease HtpX [Candidatus Uhrbacteria bacterium RIFCSPHIGHO2_01_FULL_46_23]OGL68736.1 MAG: zinc metalloprotease HtpX [Candidatus Uhrbacteria bacterium RIFCSPHIGHO2_02_FULL_47_29]OGL74762.1 MAG: zinc metalloprotease HtpX [Candidatus Uhrbacteria bacterium RIFCSPHIGHO2_12_FULL_46_13]OGL82173.1 MAG: zinc metalloprotease HtpX [Candidatus Uhrbacteria bacterium RIFCSPLOWO2_01_FULL_47_25]OGL8
MPTLYTNRDANIRKTWLLFTFFFGIIIGIGWLFSQAYGSSSILYIAVLFSSIMSIVSYWYSDKIVLQMTHAVPVTRENARELYNVVENLCITAGLPVPKIYMIEDPAPNAFATGRNPEHAVVAVTTGLMERLDRSELEGVLAHELSHIGNRDILVSTVAVILVGFISILSDFFMRSFFWGRRGRDRGGNGIFILIAIVLSFLAPLAATLMQLAISRKREFLADASGALLTRYPEGLARALEKISRDPTPLQVANNSTAHLWFENPFRTAGQTSFWHKLFMTHPPVEERIQAIRGIKV